MYLCTYLLIRKTNQIESRPFIYAPIKPTIRPRSILAESVQKGLIQNVTYLNTKERFPISIYINVREPIVEVHRMSGHYSASGLIRLVLFGLNVRNFKYIQVCK